MKYLILAVTLLTIPLTAQADMKADALKFEGLVEVASKSGYICASTKSMDMPNYQSCQMYYQLRDKIEVVLTPYAKEEDLQKFMAYVKKNKSRMFSHYFKRLAKVEAMLEGME